jgi:dephospho-CoA kinase
MLKPLQIGITGGIGSGKSVVCKLFSILGIPVYNADDRAKWLTNHDPEIREKVIALLGFESYTKEGFYNRAFVASVVFKNEELLKKLNAIIHPAVLKDTGNWVSENADSIYLIKEAAIMKKAGENNNLDYVVIVEAPIELRIQRILRRDNRTENEIRAIIQQQASDEERAKIADFTIHNNETSALIPQVLKLHEFFKKSRQA